MRYSVISVLLCALMATMTPVHAAVYKWTNEKGETIYSQTPPPAGTQGAERVKNLPRSPANSGQSSTMQKTKDNAAAFEKRRDERKTREQDQKKLQQAEADRQKQCDQMRKDVETLTSRPLVRRTDEKGESRVLSAEEKEADIKVLRDRLKEECQ